MAKIFWSNIIRYVCVVWIVPIMPLGIERSNYDQIISSNNSLCDDSSITDLLKIWRSGKAKCSF